jgi:hypothetical protein
VVGAPYLRAESIQAASIATSDKEGAFDTVRRHYVATMAGILQQLERTSQAGLGGIIKDEHGKVPQYLASPAPSEGECRIRSVGDKVVLDQGIRNVAVPQRGAPLCGWRRLNGLNSRAKLYYSRCKDWRRTGVLDGNVVHAAVRHGKVGIPRADVSVVKRCSITEHDRAGRDVRESAATEGDVLRATASTRCVATEVRKRAVRKVDHSGTGEGNIAGRYLVHILRTTPEVIRDTVRADITGSGLLFDVSQALAGP